MESVYTDHSPISHTWELGVPCWMLDVEKSAATHHQAWLSMKLQNIPYVTDEGTQPAECTVPPGACGRVPRRPVRAKVGERGATEDCGLGHLA